MCLTYVQYYIYKRRGIEMFSLLLFFFCLLYSCWVLFCVCASILCCCCCCCWVGSLYSKCFSCLSHFVFVFCFCRFMLMHCSIFLFRLRIFCFLFSLLLFFSVCVICVCFSSLYRSLNILFAYNWIFACALFFLFLRACAFRSTRVLFVWVSLLFVQMDGVFLFYDLCWCCPSVCVFLLYSISLCVFKYLDQRVGFLFSLFSLLFNVSFFFFCLECKSSRVLFSILFCSDLSVAISFSRSMLLLF